MKNPGHILPLSPIEFERRHYAYSGHFELEKVLISPDNMVYFDINVKHQYVSLVRPHFILLMVQWQTDPMGFLANSTFKT